MCTIYVTKLTTHSHAHAHMHTCTHAHAHALAHAHAHAHAQSCPRMHAFTHSLTPGLPLRGMYNLGMISDKALQAVVLWLNGRYCAAAAAAVAGAAALLGPYPPKMLSVATLSSGNTSKFTLLPRLASTHRMSAHDP